MERLRGNPARHRRGSTRLTSAVIYNFSSFFIPDGHQSTESFVQILFFPPWLPWTDTTTKRNGLPLGAPRRQLETMSSLNLPNFFFFFSTRHSSAGALLLAEKIRRIVWVNLPKIFHGAPTTRARRILLAHLSLVKIALTSSQLRMMGAHFSSLCGHA